MRRFTRGGVVSARVALLAVLAVVVAPVHAGGAIIRSASGANPAAIQAAVDQFRADLGGANNGASPPAASGRREINWDGVPDNFSTPNFMPPNFFNVNSPRGVVFSTIDESLGAARNEFLVSADTSNPDAAAVEFANIDVSYGTIFQTFSAQRLFSARDARLMDVVFYVPGTTIPATVAGFGVVFADIDNNDNAVVRCFAANGAQELAVAPAAASNGLSFVGFTFDTAAQRCARVQIEFGSHPLASGNLDGAGVDVIAMDDFIYGEPRSIFDLFENSFEQ